MVLLGCGPRVHSFLACDGSYNSNKNTRLLKKKKKKNQNTISTEPNKMYSWLVNLLISTKIKQNHQSLAQFTAPY